MHGTAFRLLAVRDRSREEMRRALLNRGFDEEAVLNLLDELQERDYLGDERLAQALAERRLQTEKVGPLRVRHELLRRGVAQDIAERAVAMASSDFDPRRVALRLAVKKMNTCEALSQDKKARRVGRFLMQRGFSKTTVNWVLHQLLVTDE